MFQEPLHGRYIPQARNISHGMPAACKERRSQKRQSRIFGAAYHYFSAQRIASPDGDSIHYPISSYALMLLKYGIILQLPIVNFFNYARISNTHQANCSSKTTRWLLQNKLCYNNIFLTIINYFISIKLLAGNLDSHN
jgi:hypothetical protein